MTDAPPKILVAGIGNIFLGDDAFGSEVARKLMSRPQPANVRVVDFGIRGLDLVYALLDGCDLAILIDDVPREGNPPGTLFLLEPRLDAPGESPPLVEGHSMDAVKVLHTAIAMGAQVNRVLIVGCQPGACEPLDEAGLDAPMEMIAAVRGAIDEAVQMVESLIHQPLSALHSAQPSMEVSP